MWRFVAILVLALVGMVWFVFFADFVQRCALVTAFAAAAMLPAVMNATRHWARGFFLCFDMVYTAACIGAWFGAYVSQVPRLEVFTASLIPGLLFGTMASLGVGRSGLGEIPDRHRTRTRLR
jgi:hypothetical protein